MTSVTVCSGDGDATLHMRGHLVPHHEERRPLIIKYKVQVKKKKRKQRQKNTETSPGEQPGQRTRRRANVERQAVYRGSTKQKGEAAGSTLAAPSGRLPELLRAQTRPRLTSLVSLGMSESRWGGGGALRDQVE